MTFHLLNINAEPTASLLFGYIKNRDGQTLTVIYELQEGHVQKLLPYTNELLEALSRVLDTPETEVVMTYHRLRYSGVWYQYKPISEVQDTQSLDFMGFDDDLVRVAAQDTSAYSTIHIRIEGFAKDTRQVAVFGTLTQLWAASSSEDDFKTRVAAWAASSKNKTSV